MLKGQPAHSFYELAEEPWIQFIVVLILLAILFFFATTRVHANMPSSSTFAAEKVIPKSTTINTVKPLTPPSTYIHHINYTDITNEATQPVQSVERSSAVIVQPETDNDNLFGRIFDVLKGIFSVGAD